MKILNDNEPLDICAKCSKVQEYGTMSDVYYNTFDIFCDKCIETKVTEQEVESYFTRKAQLVHVVTQMLNEDIDIKDIVHKIKTS